jgi:c(7)-type cytochrome triheme protein
MKQRAWLLALSLSLVTAAPSAQTWPRLRDDGIHDPRSPAIKEKQEPAAALSALATKAPDAGVGNQVRWVHLIEKGAIAPRSNLWPDTKIRVLDLDIYLDIGGSMPVVRFPHRAHTFWLDCSNCHDSVFKSVAGETAITMLEILEGEQCGICHGAVAFPLTECARCHSVPQGDFLELEKRLGLTRTGPKRSVAR